MEESVIRDTSQTAAGQAEPVRSDELLIDRFRRGDRSAFGEIVERYKKEMVNYLYRLVGDAGWAEDLAQDVFLKVYLKADHFRARSKFSTWLYRIAHNRGVDFLKRRRHEPKLVLTAGSEKTGEVRDFDVVDHRDSPDGETHRGEMEKRIMGIVEEMDDKYREVFVLCAMKRLSYEDAAEVLDCSVKTVSSRLCRARKFFRAKVQPFLDVQI
jgi:RNA polymerase sigma-70 factor (ECF subfamily)